MCEYHGKHYELYRSHYRGTPDGYFCNGIDLQEPPRNKRYVGYIRVEGRIVFVYRDSRLPYILLFMVSLVVVLVFMYVDTTTYNDYQGHVVVASNELNLTIIATAKQLGLQEKLHVGMLTTMDVYGPYIDYDRVLKRIPQELQAEILGEEMEAFALVHVANSLNRKATAMATVADSKFSNVVMSIEDRQKSLDDMIILALEAIIK